MLLIDGFCALFDDNTKNETVELAANIAIVIKITEIVTRITFNELFRYT